MTELQKFSSFCFSYCTSFLAVTCVKPRRELLGASLIPACCTAPTTIQTDKLVEDGNDAFWLFPSWFQENHLSIGKAVSCCVLPTRESVELLEGPALF